MSAVARSIELPVFDRRAAVSSVDEEARTVEMVWSTGADVERVDWWTGKRYIERLSLKPEHVLLERLNNAGPLLDTHSAWSVSDILGAVVGGSVRLLKNEARAVVRFARDEQIEPIWQRVMDGIIRSVSVGYRIFKFEEETGKDNKMPVRTATLWEPHELSLVPMPADAGAKVRGEERRRDTNSCLIVPCGLSDLTGVIGDADRSRRLQLARARRY